ADVGVLGLTLDRPVLGGLVVGQLALALAGIWPGVVAELTPGPPPALAPGLAVYFGAGAQLLLAVLAGVLAVNLWELGRPSIVCGLILLAFTLAVLWAGPFSAELAAASALRWGLAACFLLVSGIVWVRRPLAKLASTAGIHFRTDSPAASFARGLL